jgi:hypothetical protein
VERHGRSGNDLRRGALRGDTAGPHACGSDHELRRPAGSKVGEIAAEVLSNPEREVREDLQNFARLVERGELNGGA